MSPYSPPLLRRTRSNTYKSHIDRISILYRYQFQISTGVLGLPVQSDCLLSCCAVD